MVGPALQGDHARHPFRRGSGHLDRHHAADAVAADAHRAAVKHVEHTHYLFGEAFDRSLHRRRPTAPVAGQLDHAHRHPLAEVFDERGKHPAVVETAGNQYQRPAVAAPRRPADPQPAPVQVELAEPEAAAKQRIAALVAHCLRPLSTTPRTMWRCSTKNITIVGMVTMIDPAISQFSCGSPPESTR